MFFTNCLIFFFLQCFFFTTGQHNVGEVTEDGYDDCNTANAISTSTTGRARITLNKTCDRYFICGFPAIVPPAKSSRSRSEMATAPLLRSKPHHQTWDPERRRAWNSDHHHKRDFEFTRGQLSFIPCCYPVSRLLHVHLLGFVLLVMLLTNFFLFNLRSELRFYWFYDSSD